MLTQDTFLKRGSTTPTHPLNPDSTLDEEPAYKRFKVDDSMDFASDVESVKDQPGWN